MDNLLPFTPSKEPNMNKLEDLLKALLKNGLRYCLRNANCSEPIYNIWAITYLFKTRRYVYNPRETGWK